SSDADSSTITDTATASTTDSNTVDSTSSNNSQTATTTVITQADVAITSLTDTPDPVTAGNNLTYTINFANNGPSDASTVTVSDALPANTTLVSAAVLTGTGWSRTDSVAVGANGTIVFSNGSVAASATASFQVVVKVASGAPTGAAALSDTATAATT